MSDAGSRSGLEERSRPFVFDFDSFDRMAEAGLFDGRSKRIELIEGAIIEMAPAAADHTVVTSRLLSRLFLGLEQAGVTDLQALTQGTLKIADHSGPMPDVFVARRRAGQKYFLSEDCVLVAEVAVTTVDADLTRKRPLYARAGIPEFWLIEPEARKVRVHRRPKPAGEWGEEIAVIEGVVSPLFSPEIEIALADIFRDA